MDILKVLKSQRGNIASLDLFFFMYFSNTEIFDSINNITINDLSEEFLIYLVKKNNLNVSNSNLLFREYNSIKNNGDRKYLNYERLTKKEFFVRRITIYHQSSELKFGMYRHKTIEEVLNVNPEYLLWCIINVDHFSIDSTLFIKMHSFIKSDHYIKALEYNLIKHLLLDSWKFNLSDSSNEMGVDQCPTLIDEDSDWEETAFTFAFKGDIEAENGDY